MRFKWISRLSRRGFVNAAAIRVDAFDWDIEKAIRETLYNGMHCEHPEQISEETMTRLREAIADKLQELEKGRTRREGKRPAG